MLGPNAKESHPGDSGRDSAAVWHCRQVGTKVSELEQTYYQLQANLRAITNWLRTAFIAAQEAGYDAMKRPDDEVTAQGFAEALREAKLRAEVLRERIGHLYLLFSKDEDRNGKCSAG